MIDVQEEVALEMQKCLIFVVHSQMEDLFRSLCSSCTAFYYIRPVLFSSCHNLLSSSISHMAWPLMSQVPLFIWTGWPHVSVHFQWLRNLLQWTLYKLLIRKEGGKEERKEGVKRSRNCKRTRGMRYECKKKEKNRMDRYEVRKGGRMERRWEGHD